jgi:tRNA pseudouridine32 synthase/23S rRNA pseudouridine746 synthase
VEAVFTVMPGAVAGDGPFPNPFDEPPPAALARRAAAMLQHELATGAVAPGVSTEPLWQPGGGKMFGVLVVARPDGVVGFLRAFSGTFLGRWDLPGWAPPLFDRAARAAIETPGEVVVKSLHARARDFATGSGLAAARTAQHELLARHADELASLRLRNQQNRALRRERRAPATTTADELQALDQASRIDKAERRRLLAAHLDERLSGERALAVLERRRGALERLHRMASRRVMRAIHDCYRLRNARGETASLRALYAPGEPPAGAADCAAPKLLASAFARGWKPLALAEFWWGAPPPAGARVAGEYYRACREKCGPLLPFLLQGLDVGAVRGFVPPSLRDVGLVVVHADDRLVVVDKPPGLRSVPGHGGAADDSVLQRLRECHPAATGPLLTHRLDLDTSGLLVATLDAAANAHLQKQFERRIVVKRYIAWIDAELASDSGIIELPIRLDVNDRPRQIHDPVGGRSAVTEWKVLERRGGRTRVALYPRTGRTHQLRVHAAHPLGLGAAIVGDRLYGHGGERLLLHAEAITLRHPSTGAWVTFESPAPF